ncbi:MAG: metallophosphoesterase [Desulfurococcaceae archaeon]
MVQIRLIYATDLHGSDLMFKKLVSAALLYKANVVVVGGDITGKGIVPIVQKRTGEYEASVYGTRYTAKSREELDKILKLISNYGFYPYITSEHELEAFSDQQAFEKLYYQLSTKRLREWIEYARDKLKEANVEFYMMPGNDDPYEVDEVLKDDFVVNHARKALEIADGRYVLIGYDRTNVTPWKCPRDVDEELIEKELEEICSRVRMVQPVILNTHCPPYGTLLDLAPKLDKDLKPVISGGSVIMEHVGCVSVRRIIEKYQPLLGLHGHIHESRAVDNLRKTIIVNPGSAYNEGVLFMALVVLENGKVKSTLLLKG